MEQTRAPTNRNRITGVVAQGERADDREALAAKEPLRKSGGGAGKVTESYLGEVSPCTGPHVGGGRYSCGLGH